MKVRRTRTISLGVVLGIAVLSLNLSAYAQDDPYKALLTYDFGQSRRALTTIEEEIRGATAEQCVEIEAKFLEVLQSPEATFAGKQFACRMLRRIGTSESVPVLAGLLADEQMSHMARFALQEMPDPKVDEVLREALDKLSGDLRIGVIGTIGARRDRKAVDKLAGLVTSRNTDLARAAISALGRIGGVRAARTLARARVSDELEVVKADAYLMCADSLLADGETRDAVAIYRKMVGETNPTVVRVAALRGIVQAEKAKAVQTVVAMLKDEDAVVRHAAGKLAGEVPGTAATRTVAAQLPRLEPGTQTVVLSALADRGDDSALPAVVRAARSADEGVRIAAIRAIAVLGNASSVGLLAEAAAGGGDAGTAAMDALRRLRGADVASALIEVVEDAGDPAVRAKTIEALNARRETTALPVLLRAAKDHESNVRNAAYRALGALGGAAQLPDIVTLLLGSESSSERRNLERALTSVVGRVDDADVAAAPIIAGLERADEAASGNLLVVLGRVGGGKAREVIEGKLDSSNLEVKKAAIRAMGGWPDASPAAGLLDIAKGDPDESCQVLALRGYVRLIGLPSDLSAEERLDLHKAAMEIAGRPDEKRLILSGVANLESEEALEFVKQYLEDEDVGQEARRAYERISESLED
jgi:HEAT repeat protein